MFPNISYLFPQEQLAPTMGHEVIPYQAIQTLSRMVSTRSKAGIVKHPEAGPTMYANITPDLAAILEGQAKMQQELVDLKKRSVDEMEALRQENSRLRRKIEANPTEKGQGKESSKATKSPAYQPNEEESEYNPTLHTFTITQQSPIISIHHTNIHHPTTIPKHPTRSNPVTTFPTTHIPPHHFTTTFPTIICHPIPPHPLPPQPPKRCHPFIDIVTNTPLPTQWEPFTLDRYTGEIDLDEHLKVYITHVALYASNNVVFCKAFPITLIGLAFEWFTTLPLYSIDCFDTRSHLFTTHFTGSRPHQATPYLSSALDKNETRCCVP